MRGKANIGDDIGDDFRITPAYAGKSSIVSPSSAVDWDHPRLCGEKAVPEDAESPFLGSPPPMRGKVHTFVGIQHYTWDHPRLCGEKIASMDFFAVATGSPPPMRGKETIP